MNHDDLLQVTADWEVSCLELEHVIEHVRTLNEAMTVWRHIQHLMNRLDQVHTIAARRCNDLSS